MNAFVLTDLSTGLLLADSTTATSAPVIPIGGLWFWGLLLAACLVWYSTVTIYVAIRGALDIKHMLARLQHLSRWDQEPPN